MADDIFILCKKGELETLKFLYENCKIDLYSKDILGASLIHHACNNNKIDILEWLISQGVSINLQDKHGWTPLHYAIQKENVYIVDYLLKNRADFDIKDIYGKTPIHYASIIGNLDIIELLINKHLDL